MLLLQSLINFCLPHCCPLCQEELLTGPGLCDRCWADLRFIEKPHCSLCALPLENAQTLLRIDEIICAKCAKTPPSYNKAHSVLYYDEVSRRLLLSFKHGDRTDLTPFFARILAPYLQDFLPESSLILPVPLHPRRLFKRRFNQAALIAQKLAKHHSITYRGDVLLRRKNTPSQGFMNPQKRKKNVHNAFTIPPRKRNIVAGKSLVLVDDVITTGATIESCGKALLNAGAGRVYVLSLARVMPSKYNGPDYSQSPV